MTLTSFQSSQYALYFYNFVEISFELKSFELNN